MPYYVELTTDPQAGTGSAQVVGPMTAAQFTAKYGSDPAQMGVKGQTDAGYATKAEAQKAAAPYEHVHDQPLPGVNPVKNPLDSIQEVGHWLGVLATDLTDVAMWRSLGWIALGGIMMIAGVFLFLKDKGIIPDVMPLPVPV